MALLEIVRVAGFATVQDGGRRGHMHEGVPAGGALVPELFERANEAALNPPTTASIELFGAISVVARGAPVRLACEDGTTRIVHPGDRLEIQPSRTTRVRYLAARGGIDVPLVLGGRGTLVAAGLGGLEGRALRRGDCLSVGSIPKLRPDRPDREPLLGGRAHPPRDAIRVIVGPDTECFESSALDALFSESFVVLPSSDRVGTRLAGRPLETRRGSDRRPSRAMVPGAIEVPASGELIVLGPDHPTTGGYPVIGVVIRADRGRFAQRPFGDTVRFEAIGLEEARRASSKARSREWHAG